MRKEIKDLPKELQDAYAKAPDRVDENTPSFILEIADSGTLIELYRNQFLVTQIVNFVDTKLLDLELDVTTKKDDIYRDFAIEVVNKMVSTIDLETKESKKLDFYDNNPEKIRKLKAKDFAKIGNLSGKTTEEKAMILAEFYGVEHDEAFLKLSKWEKSLFVDKVISRQDTSVEKN